MKRMKNTPPMNMFRAGSAVITVAMLHDGHFTAAIIVCLAAGAITVIDEIADELAKALANLISNMGRGRPFPRGPDETGVHIKVNSRNAGPSPRRYAGKKII